MVVHVATAVAPSLASQSAAVMAPLIPFQGWLNTTFRVAHMLQFYFDCLANYDLLSNRPANAGIGAALYVIDNGGALRAIARIAFAARLVIRCMDDARKLKKQADRVATAIKCTFPIPTGYLKAKGALDAEDPNVPQHLASKLSFLPEEALTCVLKTEQIVTTTGAFAWGCVKFLPNLAAIGRVVNFDTTAEMNAFAHLIDNAGEVFDRLTNNREALSNEIEENRDAITHILETTGSRYKVEELYRFVANSELPTRARRLMRQVREVTVDAAVTVQYALTGGVSRPLHHTNRRLQQVPLSFPKPKEAYDDNAFAYTPRCASSKLKDL